MLSQNFIQLIGRVGTDPETFQTIDLRRFSKISLATHDRFKSPEGKFGTQTIWHQVYFSGKLRQFAQAHLKKGDQIQVLGKLEYKAWIDKDGAQRHSAYVIAKEMLKISIINTKVEQVSDSDSDV